MVALKAKVVLWSCWWPRSSYGCIEGQGRLMVALKAKVVSWLHWRPRSSYGRVEGQGRLMVVLKAKVILWSRWRPRSSFRRKIKFIYVQLYVDFDFSFFFFAGERFWIWWRKCDSPETFRRFCRPSRRWGYRLKRRGRIRRGQRGGSRSGDAHSRVSR